MEDSVYIDPNHIRKGARLVSCHAIRIVAMRSDAFVPVTAGVGKALLSSLITRCEALGIRQMLSRIGDSANEGSIGLHTALGFAHIGTLPSVGWKFDRWLDVVIMQRPIGDSATTPPVASPAAAY